MMCMHAFVVLTHARSRNRVLMLRRQPLLLGVKVVAGIQAMGSEGAWQRSAASEQASNTIRDSEGKVNINALPNTIPGVSREELAERLRKMGDFQRQKAVDAHRESISKQIDTMRRAMPPEEFKKFLRELEETEAKSMDEAEKMNQMTPTELYRYQLKKNRNENMRQWLNVIFLVGAFLFGIYFLFYFLLFHFH